MLKRVTIDIFKHSRPSKSILTKEVSSLLQHFVHQALTLCLQIGIDPVEVKVQFNASPSANETQGDHPGRYHLTTAPEVALLMPRHIPVGSTRQIVCDMRNSSNS